MASPRVVIFDSPNPLRPKMSRQIRNERKGFILEGDKYKIIDIGTSHQIPIPIALLLTIYSRTCLKSDHKILGMFESAYRMNSDFSDSQLTLDIRLKWVH